MADTPSDWSEALLAAGRERLRAVQSGAAGCGGARTNPTPPPDRVLDEYWDAVERHAPPGIEQLLYTARDQSRAYLELATSLMGPAGAPASTRDPPGPDPAAHLLRNWQRTTAALLEPFAIGDRGTTHGNDTAAAWTRYRHVLERYIDWSAAQTRQTLACLQRELAKESVSVDSQRALFDLWVDCAESVYAQAISEDEFAVLCGELVNALVELRARLAAARARQ